MRTASACVLCLAVFVVVWPLRSTAQLTVTDVSPNGAFGTLITKFEAPYGVNPTGRINALVVDPTNDNILYAASPFAGVWKSIDRAQSWRPASQGLRNGLTQATNAALAIDDQNPLRLLYASTEVDGRVRFACPVTNANDCNFGGLYYTLDGANTWQHINFDSVISTGFCRRIDIQAVAFAAGIAFVANSDQNCQLLMSTDPTLQYWTQIQPAFSPGGIVMATTSSPALPADGGGPVLFFCRGNTVWRASNLLSSPSWQTVSLPQPCGAITAVPTSTVPNIAAVTVTQSKPNACPTTFAYLADFGTQSATAVGPPYSTDCASGIYGIWAPARPTNPTQATGPGANYDLYATDTKWIYHYKNGGWFAMDATVGLHVDTWSMAFPSNYDPLAGHCHAYAANDGGVAATTTDNLFPALCSSADATLSWVGAFDGLHVFRSEGVTAVPHPIDIGCTLERAFEFNPIQPCPTLYVGSADDDTWVSNYGGWPLSSWQDLRDYLGDSSRVMIDPATPSVGLAVRGPNNYNRILGTKNQPPQPGDPVTGANQSNATILSQAPGPTGVAVVFTPPGDKPAAYGDYFDVETFVGKTCAAAGNCPNDTIERNLKLGDPKNASPNQTWADISPLAHFPAGHVGGIYVSGGHKHPTVYVMIKNTAPIQLNSPYRRGQIWKGIVDNKGEITSWTDVSGVPPFNVLDAYNLFVNPYDADEVYAVDLGDGTIKMTRDGGVSWVPRPDLKSVATNYGEFDFDCGSFADGTTYQEGGTGPQIFGSACPITEMVFVRDVPSFRFAMLYPGGVAFSRDAGVNWMPLDVTHAQPSQQPIEPPNTGFFDPTVDPVTGNTSLFVGLLGRGVERITGRFDRLAAVQMSYCGYCIPGVPPVPAGATVTATVSPLNATVTLHDQSGVFRGSALFDSTAVNSVTVQFLVNGQVVQTITHTITPNEAAAGIVEVDGGVSP